MSNEPRVEEERRKLVRELIEIIKTPEFQEKVKRNIAEENERFAQERDRLKPSRRQMEEPYTV